MRIKIKSSAINCGEGERKLTPVKELINGRTKSNESKVFNLSTFFLCLANCVSRNDTV